MTGFFGKKKLSNPGQLPLDRDNACRLAVVLKRTSPDLKWRLSTWADCFRLLREERGEAEVDRVLNWLETSVGDRWTPVVHSAKSFREKFDQLIAAVERHEEEYPPDLPISDDARKIAVRLGGLYWPKDEKPDELKLIQASLDGHRDWMNLCRRAKVKHPDQAGLIDCLLAFGGDANDFVEHWVASVHRIAWTNEQWAGKLARHAATMKHPRFQKIVAGWISEYRGQGDWWPFFEGLLH